MKAKTITGRDVVAAVAGALAAGAILSATGAAAPRSTAPGPYAVVPVATSDQEGARGIIIDTRDGRGWIVIGATVRPLLYDGAALRTLPALDGLEGVRAPVDITPPAPAPAR